jgi:hypothetical protein
VSNCRESLVSGGIVAAIALDGARFPTRRAWPAADDRHRVDEREQLADVVAIAAVSRATSGIPCASVRIMMFRPGLAAIGRVRSSFFPRRKRQTTSRDLTLTLRHSPRLGKKGLNRTAFPGERGRFGPSAYGSKKYTPMSAWVRVSLITRWPWSAA